MVQQDKADMPQAQPATPAKVRPGGQKRPKAPKLIDDKSSGEIRVSLPALEPGSRVAGAPIKVSGRAYQGLLANFSGARATAATVTYGSDADSQAFVIDFGAPRAILGLDLLDDSAVITLVLSWLGTDFSNTPAFPAPSAPSPGTPPVPDTTGETEVSFAGMETQKLFVQLSGTSISAADFPTVCRIFTDTVPTNVRASVAGRLPFWSHPGPLNEEVEVTGLTEALNAVLKDATADGALEVTFATDAPGVIVAQTGAFDVSRSAAACWGSDTKTDVNLEALETRTLVFPFPVAGTPSIGSVALDLAGKFPPWRACPAQTAGDPGRLGVKVDSHFSVARRFLVTETAELHGVALPLRLGAEAAELHLDILADKDGLPVSTKPLASADIKLAAGASAGPQWTDAILPQPLQLAARTPVWAVLKAKTGQSEWAGVAAAGFDTLFSDEGGPWQRYPAPAPSQYPLAQMRILRRPFASEAAALVEIGGAGLAHPATWSPSAGSALTLTLSPAQSPARSGGTVSLPLTLKAAATGTLTIQRATAFYKAEP